MPMDSTDPASATISERALQTWLLATRPQFFTVIILPVLLGAAVGSQKDGTPGFSKSFPPKVPST